jgi:ABC-type uncharacterized transport system fused permease/ATPase subunit
VLGGLWPLSAGTIRKPGGSGEDGLSHDIFYVPQRPYVTVGTLQEQLIYPRPVEGVSSALHILAHGTLSTCSMACDLKQCHSCTI